HGWVAAHLENFTHQPPVHAGYFAFLTFPVPDLPCTVGMIQRLDLIVSIQPATAFLASIHAAPPLTAVKSTHARNRGTGLPPHSLYPLPLALGIPQANGGIFPPSRLPKSADGYRTPYGLTLVPSRRRRFPQRISKLGSSVMGNLAANFSSRSIPRPGR